MHRDDVIIYLSMCGYKEILEEGGCLKSPPRSVFKDLMPGEEKKKLIIQSKPLSSPFYTSSSQGNLFFLPNT